MRRLPFLSHSQPQIGDVLILGAAVVAGVVTGIALLAKQQLERLFPDA